MKIIEPGHVYELHNLDAVKPKDATQTIYFVNREKGTEHPGTQTQEVLRALIDRTIHCDNCLRWEGNDEIIFHLRAALILHEIRTLQRKLVKGDFHPEAIRVGDDGHFELKYDINAIAEYQIQKARLMSMDEVKERLEL